MLAAALAAGAVAVMSAVPASENVRVWQDTLRLPTYAEGPANPNPPFDLFAFGRLNYPYPIRDSLTDRRESVAWRSLHLENEYLRLTVLPDLGGHIYSCLDKRSGREMFYANRAIKKALIGYRGAWAAFGVEFNFPVSHNWMSLSPVDFAAAEHPDGSGSIWVGNTDQVYGGQWRVELRLDPGRAVLEQYTDLYNGSDARHRYYWWNNAAVQAWEDSRLVYPTELMATHGFTRIEPWPIDRNGRDLSVIRNQTDGPVSLFTHGTREEFVGVYHPRTGSGTVHVASRSLLPSHKVWSWGYDREAAEWRKALSDDDSGYVELQSGLFRNQETYAFLEPQETVRFSEHWLPVRDLGGITRANENAVLHMSRPAPDRVSVAVDVTRDVPRATVTVRAGTAALAEMRLSLSPRETWRHEVTAAPGSPVTFAITDAAGRIVLTHTEDRFDRTPSSAARVGPQPAATLRSTDEVDSVLGSGLVDELEGRRLGALSRYEAALATHPSSLPVLKAGGRLGVALGWHDPNAVGAPPALRWLEAAYARNTTDAEVQYYLGLALAANGRTPEAIEQLQSAQRFRATRTPATLQLARLLAAQGDDRSALRGLESLAGDGLRAPAIGALEAGLLRRLGRDDEARQRAQHWRQVDPLSSALRHELVLLGTEDPGLWLHLGADANRVLDVVDHYLAFGAYRDALGLLERQYPEVAPPMREPGAVPPNASPLVAYYRGFARAKLGGNPAADYKAAQSLDVTYVFPNRPSSFAVLRAALQANRDDATAQFLIGSLYLSRGLVAPAIAAWQSVRTLKPATPTLHRSLGLALLQGQSPDFRQARAVLDEGTRYDSRNVEVYAGLDAVLSAAHALPGERVEALRRYPSADAMPPALVLKLALALAEAGDSAGAERLFHDRFFPREEGGTSVRSVYTHVRLTSAVLAARAGACDKALAWLAEFTPEQPPAIAAMQIADVEAQCGRGARARDRRERAARGLAADGAPLTVAIADGARAKLERPRTAGERVRLERALDAATATLASGATSSPGLMELARALLLAQLGRGAEARRALQRVFLYPDRGLSHALARASGLYDEVRQ